LPPPDHHRRALAAYLLLACLYLWYLPHVEFVLDDWFLLGRYEEARRAGSGEQIRLAGAIVQNQFHNQFRFQFLSFSLGYLVWLLVDYSPRVVFVLILGLQLGCAMILRQVCQRLGTGEGPAFLAGALLLATPTAHGPLLWSFNCMYFVWANFWFLLYLRSLAACLAAGRLDRRSAIRQGALLLLALFSGDPVFALLLAAAPLAAWRLRSRAGPAATLLAWATVLPAAAAYALLINRAPLVAGGVGLRYDFSPARFWENLVSIADTYQRLSGLIPGSYYSLWSAASIGAGALAAAVVVLGLRGVAWRPPPLARGGLLAAGLWIAAYGPIWFLRGHEFRYDYVPSPYLAMALSLAAFAWRPLRLPLAGVLAGWLAAATVANIEQGWIPQSRHLRSVAERLRGFDRAEPGDLILLSGAPLWMGTAPHFAWMAGWASSPFAQRVTGVPRVEAACDIVQENGRLRVSHYNYMRDLGPEEAVRTRILVVEPSGRLSERRLLAQETQPGAFRLFALKSHAGPPAAAGLYRREQLALLESEIYFAKPFDSHHH